MQQRQLRLGDILDDYCPRERRVTNHVIVAMIADDVKQVRCTTCDADHEYKHAKVPRQRRKTETPAVLYAQVAASAPKRVAHETGSATAGAPDDRSELHHDEHEHDQDEREQPLDAPSAGAAHVPELAAPDDADEGDTAEGEPVD